MSWINHWPPACWSTFWKSNFKQQLGCRFDIMDNESFFVCVFWHMQLYMSWYIRSFFGFTFLNILYFFKDSCTNIFHRRSLYTLSWYIRSFFGFTFLNILYFFKYSCTNIFHRRSLYTFYSTRKSPAWQNVFISIFDWYTDLRYNILIAPKIPVLDMYRIGSPSHYKDCENVCALSYYHHQIGSMAHLPLFKVRPWNSAMHFMSFYILMERWV